MLRVAILELGFRIFIYILSTLYYYLRTHLVRGETYRQEFDVNDEFIWFVLFRIWMWLCTYFYPITAFLEVIIMLVHLRFMIYTIRNDKKQPTAASNDLSLGN